MLFKVLEKYSKLRNELDSSQKQVNEKIEEHDKEIIKNFLELHDKDVKCIHSNEEKIEKNIQCLNYQSIQMQSLTGEAIQVYDNLIEYFKEAGDLYNFCTILEKQMEGIQEKIKKISSQAKNQDETKLES